MITFNRIKKFSLKHLWNLSLLSLSFFLFPSFSHLRQILILSRAFFLLALDEFTTPSVFSFWFLQSSISSGYLFHQISVKLDEKNFLQRKSWRSYSRPQTTMICGQSYSTSVSYQKRSWCRCCESWVFWLGSVGGLWHGFSLFLICHFFTSKDAFNDRSGSISITSHAYPKAKSRQLHSEWHSVHKENKSISEYLTQIKAIVDLLRYIGDQIPLHHKVEAVQFWKVLHKNTMCSSIWTCILWTLSLQFWIAATSTRGLINQP